MATYDAIAATSEAILSLVAGAAADSPFAGTRFELYQASNLANPMTEGVSLYLYRVVVNTGRRNLPPRVDGRGRRYLPPLPLDLHYMLTAWARTAGQQQRLLGWCMRVLDNTPVLPAGLLNGAAPAADTFSAESGETVELIGDQLSIADMVSVWEVAKPNQQPSATYVARMIAIDSAVPLPDAGPVQTREFQFAKVSGR